MQLPPPGIILWGFKSGDAGDVVAVGSVGGVDADVVVHHSHGGEVPSRCVLRQGIVFHIDHSRGAVGVDKGDVVMGFVFVIVVAVIVVVIFHGGNELLKGNEGVVVGVKHLKGFSRTFRPVVVVAFHPVVSSSLAVFLGLVLVVVFVSVFVMADAVSIIVVVIFHP